MRQVVIYRGEDGYWVAECPSLPGCVSQGRAREEAIESVREAIEGYIAALQDDGLAVPEERFDALLVAVWPGCPGCPGGSVSGPSRRSVSSVGASTAVTLC